MAKTETFLRAAHLPQKHDDGMSPEDRRRYHQGVAAAVSRFVRVEDLEAFNTTETSREMAQAIMAELGDGWAWRHRGEYLMAIKRAPGVRILRAGLERLTYVWPASSAWRDCRVAWMDIEIEGIGVWRMMGRHNASGIQSGKNYSHEANNVKVNQTSNARLNEMVDNLLESGKVDLVTEGVDMNADMKLRIWRQRYATQTGLLSMWARWQSRLGTHGQRLIDLIGARARRGIKVKWVRAKVTTINPKGPRDDHRWVWGVLKVVR